MVLNTCCGAMWGVLLWDSYGNFCRRTNIYLETDANDAGLHQIRKQFILSAANFTGTAANAVYWADSARIVPLGFAAQWARAIGYGATVIISGFGIVDSILELCDSIPKTQSDSADEATQACHRMNLAIFSLIHRTAMLAWAILGIASIAAGHLLLPGLNAFLFLVSFIFFMAGMVYQNRLQQVAAHRVP